jgi:type I restriction enzyme S subunit
VSWKYQPLAGLCEVFDDGDWIETKDQSDTGIRLIQTGNVGSGEFKNRVEKARYISNDTFRRLKCTEILKGDCLISRLPDPVGRSCILPDTGERMITAVDCTIVRFGTSMVPDFFNYYSQSREYAKLVAKSTTGATRQRISRSNLGNVPIPVPPIVEQRRIVAILDEAFEAIATATANAKKNLANAREVFEAHLNATFVQKRNIWLEMTVAEAGTLRTGSTPKSSEQGNSGAYIPFVKPGDFHPDGTLNYENEGLSKKGLSGSRLIPAGSALMVCIGATIGKAGYSDRDIAVNQQVNALTPREGVCGKFAYYQMRTLGFQADVLSNAGQATLPIISKGKWGALKFYAPQSLQTQQDLVAQFEGLSAHQSAAEDLYRKKIELLNELKRSTLNKAFAGKLTSLPSHALEVAVE